jgi:hypothetical protein
LWLRSRQLKARLMWIDGIAKDRAKNELYYLLPRATFTRSLNLAVYPNGRAYETEERWAGMPFQSLLVCSSTLGVPSDVK